MNQGLLYLLILILGIHPSSFAEGTDKAVFESISIQTMDETVYNVKEILASGQNVVFIFWQTWCAACLRETPALVKAWHTHKDNIKFFGVISGEDEDVDDEKVLKTAKKFEMPYPQIRDRNLSLTRKYEVKGTPTIIIIGKGLSVLYNDNHLPKNWSEFYQ